MCLAACSLACLFDCLVLLFVCLSGWFVGGLFLVVGMWCFILFMSFVFGFDCLLAQYSQLFVGVHMNTPWKTQSHRLVQWYDMEAYMRMFTSSLYS